MITAGLWQGYFEMRRKIRLLEGQAKYRHLKKLTCKGTVRQVFICLRPRTPYPPPFHTVYLLTKGRGGEGGRVEPERRLEGHQFTTLDRKYQHDWLYLLSKNSKKHLRNVFLKVNFLDDNILHWLLSRGTIMCKMFWKVMWKSNIRGRA